MQKKKRDGDTTSIYFSLKRTALMLLPGTLLFGAGAYVMSQENPLLRAISLCIAVMPMCFFLWVYARRHLPALILTPDGLTSHMPFRRKKDIYCRWSDIVNIYAHAMAGVLTPKAIFITTSPNTAHYINNPNKTTQSRLFLAAMLLQGGSKAVLKLLQDHHAHYGNEATP